MFDPQADEDVRLGLASQARGRPVMSEEALDEARREAGERDAEMLDSPKALAVHSRLLAFYMHELDVQSQNRLEMATDEEFYDGIQWSPEEIAELKERGQFPISYNVINTTVDWVMGTQRRAPADYRILPRRKDGANAAQRKTEVFKYVSDCNNFTFEMSRAFGEAVKAGVGWIETGRGNDEDGCRVYGRHETWRAMLWDSTSRTADLSDARYVTRTKFLDLDLVRSLWPQRAGLAAIATMDQGNFLTSIDRMGDDAMDARELSYFEAQGFNRRQRLEAYDASRHRARVIEAWFKQPVNRAHIIRGGQFNGELFDPWSIGHHNDLAKGWATLITKPREVVFCAIMTEAGLLSLQRSPYRHNNYPFTAIWGKRRAADGLPYGIVRNLRDIQRDTNKRASKSLFILSTARLYVPKSTEHDVDEMRREASRPDSVIEFDPTTGIAPRIETDFGVATAHLELMSRNIQMIQSVGGVTDENLGRRTNASSGIAIERRQDQGALATSVFFDNAREAFLDVGQKWMCLIEQYMTDEDQIRVMDARGNAVFYAINDGSAEGAIPEWKADFVITDEDWRATARQAAAAALLDIVSKLGATAPDLVIGVLDLVVEALDVPKGDEIVRRIRKLTGQKDPDADPNAAPSPEEQEAEAAKAEEQAMQAAVMQLEMAEKQARVDKIKAETAKLAQGSTQTVIANMKAALEAAIAIAGAPMVADAADSVFQAAMQASQPAPAMPADGQMMPPPGAVPAPQPMPEGL